MSENKTKPTNVSVDDFLQSVSEQRQQEAGALIAIMQKISGENPVMWGPSIIGFGLQHYKSEAGREGDMGILGFSPRKASLTIYFYEGFDRYGAELAKLGKHKISQSCLYVNKLADIDLTILEVMLRSSYTLATEKSTTPSDVDAYIAAVPAAAQGQFAALRAIIRTELPDAHEVMSYGIVGYKPEIKRRALVFIGGWNDHVSMYPIPKNESLRNELEPYIHGKGTLWFDLKTPLPTKLLQKTIRAYR